MLKVPCSVQVHHCALYTPFPLGLPPLQSKGPSLCSCVCPPPPLSLYITWHKKAVDYYKAWRPLIKWYNSKHLAHTAHQNHFWLLATIFGKRQYIRVFSGNLDGLINFWTFVAQTKHQQIMRRVFGTLPTSFSSLLPLLLLQGADTVTISQQKYSFKEHLWQLPFYKPYSFTLRICPQLILFQVKKWPNKCKQQILQTPFPSVVELGHLLLKSLKSPYEIGRGTRHKIICILVHFSIYSIYP